MANTHGYEVSVRDYSDETSRTFVHFGAVTALNIAGVLAQIGDLRTAISHMILGNIAKDGWIGDRTIQSNAVPSNSAAQIELKGQFLYEGTTNHKRYRVEIPTFNPSKTIPGSDMIDLTDSDVAAFVTAFEALAKTPDNDTEGVNVLEGRLVGRNV
jgi:hypothetical protein